MDMILAAEADKTYQEIIGQELLAEGFVPAGKRAHARAESSLVTSLIRMVSLKSSHYTLEWGASLSFLPHDWRLSPKYHRTPKSARLDVFEWLPHYKAPGATMTYQAVANATIDLETFQRHLRFIWTNHKTPIKEWLQYASDPRTLLHIVERQLLVPPSPFGTHWPPPRLVKAFLLAQLGECLAAEKEFDEVVAKYKSELEPVENLRIALGSAVGPRRVEP